MLDKCANPRCTVRLHRLRGGRIFRLGSDRAADLRVSKTFAPGVEYFWLCDHCCRTYTLVVDVRNRVVVTSLPSRDNLQPAETNSLRRCG